MASIVEFVKGSLLCEAKDEQKNINNNNMSAKVGALFRSARHTVSHSHLLRFLISALGILEDVSAISPQGSLL